MNSKSMMVILSLFILSLQPVNFAGEAKWSLVIHGGAGTILRENLAPEVEQAIRVDLQRSLQAGQKVLQNDGAAMDAVIAAVMVLENSPHFNAGHGAVFTAEGKNEMDAAVMDGSNLNAGTITGVQRIKNPITLARAVMDKSRHVMFAGNGAEIFAKEHDIEFVKPEYFRVERRWQQYLKFKARNKDQAAVYEQNPAFKMGTVGAVAIDVNGNIAAGTSTGGMTGKMYGRVGDVPIIGAGTYANNISCGVSATGHGEFFIRATVARSICALMEYAGLDLQTAAEKIVMQQLVEMGGDGGIIAVDSDANVAMVFNSKGMYRGSVTSEKPLKVAIYGDDG